MPAAGECNWRLLPSEIPAWFSIVLLQLCHALQDGHLAKRFGRNVLVRAETSPQLVL